MKAAKLLVDRARRQCEAHAIPFVDDVAWLVRLVAADAAKLIEEAEMRAVRLALLGVVGNLRRHPSFTHEQREALWEIEDLITEDIEVPGDALSVCASRETLERYCGFVHCERCNAIRELDAEHGREITNLALQRARAEGLRGQ